MKTTFDTYCAIQELEKAGLTEEQSIRLINTFILAQVDLVTREREYLDIKIKGMLIKLVVMQIALAVFLAAITFFA
jgi:hypothetical protein